jgi:glutathione S-transferase
LQYLAETYDKDFKYSYKPGTTEYYLEKELLFFQVSEHGPIQGQAIHYNVFNKGVSEYAATRFMNEVKRVYGVVEQYLDKNPSGLYLVGDHYSTADVAFYSWIRYASYLDIDLSVWPKLAKWAETFGAIEEVKEGSQEPPRKQ